MLYSQFVTHYIEDLYVSCLCGCYGNAMRMHLGCHTLSAAIKGRRGAWEGKLLELPEFTRQAATQQASTRQARTRTWAHTICISFHDKMNHISILLRCAASSVVIVVVVFLEEDIHLEHEADRLEENFIPTVQEIICDLRCLFSKCCQFWSCYFKHKFPRFHKFG
jgi:hypothetical protein